MQEKYQANIAHAQHVARLALRLYDGLGRLTHVVTAHDRAVLEHAAQLHDIGHYVHSKKHHLHSCHLIRHDRLLESWPEELRLWVSVLALNHRKKKVRLEDLPAKHHARALTLIALLRMADALDYEHDQGTKLERVEVEEEERRIDLYLSGFEVEKNAEHLLGKFRLGLLTWNVDIVLHGASDWVTLRTQGAPTQ
nr:HD domain-containing protein [Tumebacillus amylolyticus]